MKRSVLALTIILCGLASPAVAQLKPEQLPPYDIRARVLRSGGNPPEQKQSFAFYFAPDRAAHKTTGSEWCPWVRIDREKFAYQLKRYPNTHLRRWPFVTGLRVHPVSDPTRIEVQVRFVENGQVVSLQAELFGPRLGLLFWRRPEDRVPQVATPRQYDRRYWRVFQQVRIADQERPKHFIIVDRYIGTDDDRGAWQAGIENLARAGFTALMIPPGPKLPPVLAKTGVRRIAWAVYSPPGYAFDYDPKVTPEAIRQWAEKQAQAYRRAGFELRQMALFAMSDEPGWYYPATYRALEKSPQGMKRFHQYLQQQGMTLKQLGCSRWEDVRPLGPSQVRSAGDRRLFYWTCRFFAWDSARHFSNCRQALADAFGYDLPVVTNWNFFAGRFYVPGPVANNPDKKHPDAAMGGHDWYEFARLRGGNMLWTEDWFGDQKAYQWSFYLARLRVAAREGGVSFGSYVIPRTAGGRKEGITQKILSITGHGGKAIKYFVFGPEYAFPGNCYSERVEVVLDMVKAHRAIGRAEPLLWPGRMPVAQVALLHPRSSQPWDALTPARKKVQIQGATNTHMNARRTGYLSELFDLYLALQHANVPADVIDEDMLRQDKLAPYRVLYVTGPDLPEEGQRQLLAWVRGGGTLVLVPGAACWNRYHEPCQVIYQAAGLPRPVVPREFYNYVLGVPWAGKGQGEQGPFRYIGPRARLAPGRTHQVVARFADDQSPAVVVVPVGKGRVVQFAWFPGLSYWRSQSGKEDGLPVGFSEPVRRWILWPALELAGVKRLVEPNQPMVEVLFLQSRAGVALTVLNWSGRPVPKLRLRVRSGFRPSRVESVLASRVEVRPWNEGVELFLPLERYEVLSLYR